MVRPPQRPPALTPLQERSAEAAAQAAAVRGTSEAAQRRRERWEAEALAADLLDRQDRLSRSGRPGARLAAAKVPAASAGAFSSRYGIVTPGWAAAWRAARELRRNTASTARAASPAERRAQATGGQAGLEVPRTPTASRSVPADVDGLGAYTEDLRRWISGQGPPPWPPWSWRSRA